MLCLELTANSLLAVFRVRLNECKLMVGVLKLTLKQLTETSILPAHNPLCSNLCLLRCNELFQVPMESLNQQGSFRPSMIRQTTFVSVPWHDHGYLMSPTYGRH